MKKFFIVFIIVLIAAGAVYFFMQQRVQEQKAEARAAMYSSFNLLDITKDYIDEINRPLNSVERDKFAIELQSEVTLVQLLDKNKQAEEAYAKGEYTEAKEIANETIELNNKLKNHLQEVLPNIKK